MAKRQKKKTRKQKIAEYKNLTCRSDRTPKKLIRELNEMVMEWEDESKNHPKGKIAARALKMI